MHFLTFAAAFLANMFNILLVSIEYSLTNILIAASGVSFGKKTCRDFYSTEY
jgi:hypothetical protein